MRNHMICIAMLASLLLSGCAGSGHGPGRGIKSDGPAKPSLATRMAGTGAVELDRNGDGKIDDDLVATTLTRDSELAAVAASKQNALLYTPENAAAKGVAGGYAELDSGGKLLLERIPDGVGGGVTSYNSLTDKPTIPSFLADLSADSTHRVVTDAEKAGWNAKQSALIAGSDYLAPNGSAANLTGFPSSLATDAEVSTAVSSKANAASLASQAAFLAAYGWLPTGTFNTAADATITGDWSFSSGLEASNINLNLGSLADLKIGNAQMVDDTKGNGDTNYLWSADKVFDQLATKQTNLVSGTTIKTINGNSLLGFGDLAISGGSGTSGYVSLSAAPYSDVACTTGQYGYYGSTAYLCTGGFWTSKWTLSAHLNPSVSALNVSDDFNRSDGALGSNWGQVGAWSIPTISSNVIRGLSGDNNMARWAADNFQADQKATIKLSTAANGGQVCVRMQTTQSGYCVKYQSSTELRITKFASGTEETLGTVSSSLSTGDTMSISAVGSTLTAWKNETPLTPTVTDSSYSTGNPGVYIWSDVVRLDDFHAEEL